MAKNEITIIKNFSKGAKVYDQYHDIQKAVFNDFFYDRFFKTIKDLGPNSILDIGCGTGYFTNQMADIFPSATIVAFDLSQDMIDQANHNYSDSIISFLKEDASNFNLDRKFNLIISNATFQWVLELDKALKCIVEHLAENGLVLLSVFGPNSFFEYQNVLSEYFKVKVPILASSFRSKDIFYTSVKTFFGDTEVQQRSIRIYFNSLKDLLSSIDNTTGANSSSKEWTDDVIKEVEQIYLEQYGKIVVTADIFYVSAKDPYRTNSLFLDQQPEKRTFTDQQLQSNYQQSKQFVTEKLLEICAKVSGQNISSFSKNALIESYGFNSLGYAKIAGHLNESLQLNLSPIIFFEHNQFDTLVDEIVEMKYENDATFSNSKKEIKPIDARESSYPGDKNTLDEEAVAIIGISGYLPQSDGLEEFWEHLKNERDLVSEIPKERHELRHFLENCNGESKLGSRWGGFLKDVDRFDASFFKISPREAELMDPQQRLLIETVWKTIEDAGYKASDLSKTQTGVFVGVSTYDYNELLHKLDIEPYSATGTHPSIIANRISYLFDFYGPSKAIDTACSSSLVAIHQAVKSIHHKECSLAIAGGVNLLLSPSMFISLNKAGMLSKDGRCKAFSDQANGYVRGEGIGTVLLKPLKQAIADGDNIYSIVKGSAENHGGRANSLTAPSQNSQARLLRKAYKDAGVDPSTIVYIECHGTGTELGDPIEIEGLKKAFGILYEEWCLNATDGRRCGLGSVKSNIGHLEAAAGIAGVFKILLSFKHRLLPSTLHCDTTNPLIRLKESPFYLVDKTNDLKRFRDKNSKEIPFRAGISSFGSGGSNAHLIIEEYRPQFNQELASEFETVDHQSMMVILSAKNKEQLEHQALNLLKFIRQYCPENTTFEDGKSNTHLHDDHISEKRKINLVDLSYTLQVGREAMEERLGIIVSSLEELKEKLEEFIEGEEEIEDLYRGRIQRSQDNMSATTAEKDREITMDTWIAEGNHSRLLELWVKGLEFDWNRLYSDVRPRRISLPTYPFADERYWIPQTKNELLSDHAMGSGGVPFIHPQVHQNTSNTVSMNHWDELTFLPKWEERSVPVLEAHPEPKGVLIVCSGSFSQFEKTIQHYYKQTGITKTLLLRLGNHTQQLSESEWSLDISDPQSFEICLKNMNPIDCFYFVSLADGESNPMDLETLTESQLRNEIQLLRLIKYFKQNGRATKPIDCYILTLDNYRIEGTPANPYGGGLTGLAYAIAQGNYQFLVRNLDLSREDLTDQQQEQLLQIVINMPASNRGEVLKIESNKTYKQTFFRFDWGKWQNQSAFREEGVYIILGGSGMVGQMITRYLIETYNANVVWIGRTPETSTQVQEKINLYQGLRQLPVYIQADVTNPVSMKHAVVAIKKRYTNINGAIFSALVFDDGNSIDKTSEVDFLKVLDVKTKGSFNFHAAFLDENLDFMCFFSSGQAFAFSGASRFSAYASGITFSDTYVNAIQNDSNFPIGIINWGYWKKAVSGTSMEDSLETRLGLLYDEEGINCFERFTCLLQQRLLDQLLCLKASEAVRDLMNINKKEIISISESNLDSPIPSFWQSIERKQDKLEIPNWHQKSTLLEEWISKLLFIQLNDLAAFSEKSVFKDNNELRKKAGILDKYDAWWQESLNILERKGDLQLESGQVKAVSKNTLNKEALWKDWELAKESLSKDLENKVSINLLDPCLQNLPDILQGKIPATDILFPKSSLEKVEDVYKRGVNANYFNNILADIVEAYIKQRIESHPQSRLRMIEIGAGTGGTTAIVLPKLHPFASHIEEYCYTDISKAFLLLAEDKYGPDNHYLIYKVLDIEKPLAGQDIEIGGYDLVIATNVLHATKNIRQTIRNAKAALRKNGLILINEISDKSLFTHLTFGLLDGWWLFEDTSLRIPGSPGLYPETWKELLEKEGFNRVSLPAEKAHQMGQQIILAQSDGIIRQQVTEDHKRPYSPPPQVRERIDQLSSGESNNNVKKHIENIIVSSLCETLRTDKGKIADDVPFSDYGVDSILGVAFIDQVSERLSISINTAIIFDYVTIDRLTDYICDTYKDQIRFQENGVKALTSQNPKTDPSNPRKQNIFAVHEKAPKHSIPMEIAVIGMSGQFPKANDVNQFWKNLVEGKNGVEELPSHYLEQDRFYNANALDGDSYYRYGGILEEKASFDPLFFNISPREAESMHPAQRLIMQESWKALEDAGYNPKKFSDCKIAVYVGSEPTAYFYESFTGSSEAIIASRLSYYLNLKGPAMVVNTGCSSSGVAIHLACESLRSGESKLALAAGVNTLLDQSTLVKLSAIEMLSPTGRCNTFDETGDGTVMSEGVGVVVLKRLEDAIIDNDAIYGTICGSGINQDGSSNGITAPNGLAQEQLIKDVYQQYRINPGDISYIEAHGTGTKLGDPVEAGALVRAFKHFTHKKGYCAIGSAKSHIGHASAAAGVIGLIKVLLSIKHQKIPELLHFNKINPLIELEDSAFFINTELSDWKIKNNKPRMAALNSFGHSGTNVHLVVSEYVDSSQVLEIQRCIGENGLFLIPLSAKTQANLKTYAKQVKTFLEDSLSNSISVKSTDQGILNTRLEDIAFTLQTGREPMEHRVIFLVKNISELKEKLDLFYEDNPDIADCWKGQVRTKKNKNSLFAADEDVEELLKKWIKKHKFKKIAESWIQGFAVDWYLLYEGSKPNRIHLPSYPFSKTSYWINDTSDKANPVLSGVSNESKIIHPLLHENTSDLSEQRFSSTFTGKEFFLDHHQIYNEKVLPGVGLLEMVRVAVEKAARNQESGSFIKLRDIIWPRRIAVSGSLKEVHIRLLEGDKGQIHYEIYSATENPQEDHVHSKGIVEFNRVEEATNLDIERLRSHMNQGTISSETCYKAYKLRGLNLGSGLKGIHEIYMGEGQLLAKIILPPSLERTSSKFVLHPSLMDSALQSTIGFSLLHNEKTEEPGDISKSRLQVPFAMESVEIHDALSKEMYAWIRYTDGSRSQGKVQKLDIDLCDQQGAVCVKMRGFTSRVLDKESGSLKGKKTMGTMLTIPILRETPVPTDIEQQDYAEHRVILCEIEGLKAAELNSLDSGSSFVEWVSHEQSLESRFTDYAIYCFETIQEILNTTPQGKILIQIVTPYFEETALFAGLSGVLKTAHLENPKIIGQLIQIDRQETNESLMKKLKENEKTPYESVIRYEAEKRFVSTFEESKTLKEKSTVAFKEDGVYLITGGLGGLGILFAKEILKQTQKTNIILTGRSAFSAQKKNILKELQSGGRQVTYLSTDVSDLKQVMSLIESIQKDYGQLDGVIHSAGIVLDSFIIKKTTEEFKTVLSPKVSGTLNLDQATKDLNLDFFVLFSSIAGITGNIGQADYATANAFMNQFAFYRNDLVLSNERIGQTLTINWPLWKEGGMKIDTASQEMMYTSMGMIAMETETGIEAFYQGLSLKQGQLLVMSGDIGRFRSYLFEYEPISEPTFNQSAVKEIRPVTPSSLTFKEKATDLIKGLLSSTLKLPVHRVQTDTPMEQYGIDSIMALNLTNQLEKTFGPLSKTLFFEYQTIDELTQYFITSYEKELHGFLSFEDSFISEAEPIEKLTSKNASSIRRTNRNHGVSLHKDLKKSESSNRLDIAIIGISGRYPQAENLEDYWINLRDGKDCITEIPEDRWDWREYYTEDRSQMGSHFSKWGGFIKGVDEFDPLFFNISPKEAQFIDPQERLFLEHAWMAVEDAGYTRETLKENKIEDLPNQVGVYAGVMFGEYQLFGAEESLRGRPMAFANILSTISNRVSYLMDLHGPSMTVDTMCSSSLTAIHLACQDLRQGRTSLGIAGGVNVSIHPNKYLMLSARQFISSRGHCESFGEGGDGYIPGEGVGVVLLKRLAQAQRDGDHIYGVIKGSAVNHDGKTNGFSVPNPNAQQSAIEQALNEAEIDPRTVSYIEAHGTGTKLGDPIEITALTKAFRKSTEENGFCLVGSAKSNIGHCESAAGIAAMTKVLLQMRHKKIAPSLHSSTLNPHIDFEKTPFIVNQTLQDWSRPNVLGKKFPRIAGISSFGAGGSNAHLIIEEYAGQPDRVTGFTATPTNRVLMPLSAKNQDRLYKVVQNLLQFIRNQSSAKTGDNDRINLANLSYTLQVGREAMEERLGLIVSSLKELEEKLEGFLAGIEDIDDLYRDRVNRNQDSLSVLTTDEDMHKIIDIWIDKGKHAKLLDLWVKGLKFDWNKLYGDSKPNRITLPTYPFAKERHWVPQTESRTLSSHSHGLARGSLIHPLLHQNTSDLSEQRFSSTFSGKEFFINDHRVNGQKILPAVGYLEMARVAVEKASGGQKDVTSLHINNVVWSRPITVNNHDQEVHIALFEDAKDQIQYEVYTAPPENEEEVIVHSQGVAEFKGSEGDFRLEPEYLRSQMNQGTLSAEMCYQTFESLGISYGPGHRAIQEIYQGKDQILAYLILPSSVEHTINEYILHPSLMDAALQSSIGLWPDSGYPQVIKPSLPFALESLDILGSCSKEMFAWVRYSGESTSQSIAQKLDIDLCDAQGKVCLKMRGLEPQEIMENAIDSALTAERSLAEPPKEETRLLCFEEVWQEAECDVTTNTIAQTLLCFLSDPTLQGEFLHDIQSISPKSQVIFVSQEKEVGQDSSQDYFIDPSKKESYLQVLQEISQANKAINAIVYLWPVEDSQWIKEMSPIVWILQSLKTVRLNVKDLLLVGEANNLEEESFLESWIGFERSLGMIFPQTKVRVLLDSIQSYYTGMQAWTNRIWNELQGSGTKSVRYHSNQRFISQIQSIQPDSNHSLIKSRGTYLITGGCGGLGTLFATYLVDQYQANLILSGRSPLSKDKVDLIKSLQQQGNEVVYIQADISDLEAMMQALPQAVKKAGNVNGIIHAAGLEEKQTLFEKEFNDFAQVLSPKIQGTLNLEQLFTEEPLDFICHFSSSSAILGDFGSCDYAIGNRFQMAYCRLRSAVGFSKTKRVVINWPLWKEGGIGISDDEGTQFYLETSGQELLSKQQGLPIFEQILSSNAVQTLVLLGQPKRIERFLGMTTDSRPSFAPQTVSSQKAGRTAAMIGLTVEQCVVWQLKESVHQLLNVSKNRLEMETNLSDFGFDSVSLTELSRLLSKAFALEITPALFFEYTTLEKLTQYLMDNHQEILQKLYREPENALSSGSVIPKAQTASSKRNLFRPKRRATAPGSNTDKIAIIGMSGRFPQARNVEELWTLLVEGKEAVQEIPPERFDWRAFYDETGKEGTMPCKWSGTIEGASEFDPLFFEISPREAEQMDPRQRLLLQESWKALEDAGYGKPQLKANKIGMFVGVEQGDYQSLAGLGSVTSNHNAILSTRLAYFLDLKGPAMAIDTACSSGLVAAHQACLSLKNKECDTAIAAGVNLLFTPMSFIIMNQAGMLSRDGKCFTFDKRANGLVPGEAVAAVVLKPLSQAEADGDPIYAVIKGSGINYDGKTNGITAPSGVAQKELLTQVYSRYQVNPEDIQYIVAHGTGTKLGDPIEINALYNAFKSHTQKTKYCALTSTKTNLGHSFAASGLVSLISLVQALRHQTIPASLNCEEENDYIRWDQSPFYVNKKTRVWPQPGPKKRLGAVSAFGMSGTNAHLLVEEYQSKNTQKPRAFPYTLLAFSAKTEESLKEQLSQMRLFLESEQSQEDSFTQLSYTLLTGRHHFDHRLALVVKDKEMAVLSLQRALNSEKLPYLFMNKVPREFTEQKAIKQYITELLVKSQSLASDPVQYQETLKGLAEFYCQGYEIDWTPLFDKSSNQRLHLPTYPFAKERYWIPESEINQKVLTSLNQQNLVAIHPLLHQNTSDLFEQRFSSTFSGKEFFLNDHRVNGQKVLPGVGYLEMARVAVEKASGRQEDGTSLHLNNVVWSSPITVNNHDQEVHIGLFGENNGQIQYKVYTVPENEEEVIVHSQGVAEFKVNGKSPALNLVERKSEMNQGTLNAEMCYQAFKRLGLSYGPGHQAIQEIYLGENQILAKLTLPSPVEHTLSEYVLHPSLMDAALQSSIGLSLNSTLVPDSEMTQESGRSQVLKPSLPFALESLEILGPCSKEMLAWVRLSGERGSQGKVQKLDIDLCDPQGTICVKMKGFSSRILNQDSGSYQANDKAKTLLSIPIWKETPIPADVVRQDYSEHHVILLESEGTKAAELNSLVSGSLCVEIESKETSLESRFTDYAIRCFEIVQEILKKKPRKTALIQVVTPFSGDQSLFAGLLGLLKTVRLENPDIVGQLIQIDLQETIASLLKKIEENKNTPFESAIRYVREKRFVSGFEEVKELKETQGELVFKENGVYLITGGLGGLGVLFAKEILKQTQEATIILTGRSELSAQKETLLEELQSGGRRAEYLPIDVSDLEQVKALINSIQKKYGPMNGIIHSAGVISDNFIVKKTTEEFKTVLAPKVSGTLNLDQATKDLNLDFFVLFSSTTGTMGNIGQADYATANAFMDQFATYRNNLVFSNERAGQTLSINWPLWKEGGMKIDAATEEMMETSTGMVAMKTEAGIKAFNQGLTLNQGQLLVMTGDIGRLRTLLFKNHPIPEPNHTQGDTKVVLEPKTLNPSLFKEKATGFIKMLLASTLKLPVHKIQTDAPMEKYGIDSVLALNMINQLEKTFGSLSKTLFFEYQTIDELTQYFINSHKEKLQGFLSPEQSLITETAAIESPAHKNATSYRRSVRGRFVPSYKNATKLLKSGVLDIAIIGVSGRYPQAENLEEYWINLRDGKDCITEVPKDRWEWRDYFTEDKSQFGSHFSKWGGFIKGVDEFDPRFFNISPQKAGFIDPQERLFLEHTWMAVEDAGYTRDTLQENKGEDLPGQVGVYVGVMYGEYQLFGAEKSLQGRRMALGSSYASIANRVSYEMNLHGPSMTVDTMCSSSLTAIHLACQDLMLNRTSLGIAGGVNVSIHPNKYLMLSAVQFISTQDHCESFGEGGDGYIPGEGVGVVLLKRLVDAERDGDQIYGVIKGSAINHGGKTNAYSVPNPNAQQTAIERALYEAEIDPRTVSYVEAHGTGTKLGDTIEITALTKAFRKSTEENGFCLVGSAKSNIGHCESAAGIAGMTKVLLQMRYQKIVPSLHSTTLNPHIDFEKTPFIVNQTLQDWSRPMIEGREVPRIAGISAFGAGGTNAHLIIEEYMDNSDDVATLTGPQATVLIPLSAKDPERLFEMAKNLQQFIGKQTADEPVDHYKVNLTNLAYTLQVGREAMEERLGLVVGSLKELEEKLAEYLSGNADIDDLYRGQVKHSQESLSDLIVNEDMQNTIDTWITKGKHAKLLDLWVKGHQFDWNRLYDKVKPKRISLPTYPFSKERHWIPDLSVQHFSSAFKGTTNAIEEGVTYETKWEFKRTDQNNSIEDKISLGVDEKIELFLKQAVADQIQKPINQVQNESTFFEQGMSSSGVVVLVKEIEKILSVELSPTLLFEYLSIIDLSKYLLENYFSEFESIAVAKNRIKTKRHKTPFDLSTQLQPYTHHTRSIHSENLNNKNLDPVIFEILENFDNGVLSPEEAELLINEVAS